MTENNLPTQSHERAASDLQKGFQKELNKEFIKALVSALLAATLLALAPEVLFIASAVLFSFTLFILVRSALINRQHNNLMRSIDTAEQLPTVDLSNSSTQHDFKSFINNLEALKKSSRVSLKLYRMPWLTKDSYLSSYVNVKSDSFNTSHMRAVFELAKKLGISPYSYRTMHSLLNEMVYECRVKSNEDISTFINDNSNLIQKIFSTQPQINSSPLPASEINHGPNLSSEPGNSSVQGRKTAESDHKYTSGNSSSS
ncbi:hypothetical protein OAT84_01815 [Gammaproteobacteria bacterium]|nr:hypothetical protein [Gammaproteobacteria bacterium]